MLEYSIHLMDAPSIYSSQSFNTCANITTTPMAFWKNSSFTEHVLQEISGTCVDTNPRDIKATCVVSSDRGRPT